MKPLTKYVYQRGPNYPQLDCLRILVGSFGSGSNARGCLLDPSFDILCLETMFVWDHSPAIFSWAPLVGPLRLGTFARKQSLGIDRLEGLALNISHRTFDWRCSPVDLRVGSLVWDHSLGNFRFWTIALDSLPRNPRLGSFTLAAFALDIYFGNLS